MFSHWNRYISSISYISHFIKQRKLSTDVICIKLMTEMVILWFLRLPPRPLTSIFVYVAWIHNMLCALLSIPHFIFSALMTKKVEKEEREKKKEIIWFAQCSVHIMNLASSWCYFRHSAKWTMNSLLLWLSFIHNVCYVCGPYKIKWIRWNQPLQQNDWPIRNQLNIHFGHVVTEI